jgi:hypothetical protein
MAKHPNSDPTNVEAAPDHHISREKVEEQTPPPVPTFPPPVVNEEILEDYPSFPPPPRPDYQTNELEIPSPPAYKPEPPSSINTNMALDSSLSFSSYSNPLFGFSRSITKMKFSLQTTINESLKKILAGDAPELKEKFDNLDPLIETEYANSWIIHTGDTSFLNMILEQEKRFDPDYLPKLIEIRVIHDYRDYLAEMLSKIQIGGEYLDQNGQMMFFQLASRFKEKFTAFKEREKDRTDGKPQPDDKLKKRYFPMMLDKELSDLEKELGSEAVESDEKYRFLKSLQIHTRNNSKLCLDAINRIHVCRSVLDNQCDLINDVLVQNQKKKIDKAAIINYAHQLDAQGFITQYGIALGQGFEKAAARAIVDKVNIFGEQQTLLDRKEAKKVQKEIKDTFYLEVMHDIISRLYNTIKEGLFFVGRVAAIIATEIIYAILGRPEEPQKDLDENKKEENDLNPSADLDEKTQTQTQTKTPKLK